MEKAIEIKINSLTFPSSTQPALANIDLTIKKGEFVCLTGGVAAGKSTLLNCITGAIPKYHEALLDGEIRLWGEDVSRLSLTQMCRYLGYMTQDPQSQIVDVDVYEDIAFGLGNLGLSLAEIDRRVKEALAYVDLQDFKSRKTDSLSGGQAQRLVLAGVLALDTDILVLDQPTAELDPKGRRELYAHLARVNREKGVTVIMVMDRSREVLPYATRVLILDKGCLARDMAPEQYGQSQKPIKVLPRPPLGEDVVVNLQGAGYTYKGDLVGCSSIDLKVNRGEFVSVVGLNGSGKTTLLKILNGLLPPTQGRVEIFSQDMNKKSCQKLRRRIGFLFQNPDYQIFADTVFKEIIFTLKLRKIAQAQMEERAIAALKSVNLETYAQEHPQVLTRGQRQVLALASVLVADPDLIIADEPTSGLDQEQSQKVMAVLDDFCRRGKTVIMVTHDLELARSYSHRLVAMYHHRIVADFPVNQLNTYRETLRRVGLWEEVGV